MRHKRPLRYYRHREWRECRVRLAFQRQRERPDLHARVLRQPGRQQPDIRMGVVQRWHCHMHGLPRARHEPGVLLNDAGTAWTSKMLGSASILQGSSCAINLGSSSASASGSELTLNLAIAFTPAFSGEKTIRMFANAAGGLSSGWQDRGSWTVTGSVPAPRPRRLRVAKNKAMTETRLRLPSRPRRLRPRSGRLTSPV